MESTLNFEQFEKKKNERPGLKISEVIDFERIG